MVDCSKYKNIFLNQDELDTDGEELIQYFKSITKNIWATICILHSSRTYLPHSYAILRSISAVYIPEYLEYFTNTQYGKTRSITFNENLESVLKKSREIPYMDIQLKYHKYGTNIITLNNQTYKRCKFDNDMEFLFDYDSSLFIEEVISLFQDNYIDACMMTKYDPNDYEDLNDDVVFDGEKVKNY